MDVSESICALSALVIGDGIIVRLIHFIVKGLAEKQAALKQGGKACSRQMVLVRAFPKDDDPQRPPLYTCSSSSDRYAGSELCQTAWYRIFEQKPGCGFVYN